MTHNGSRYAAYKFAKDRIIEDEDTASGCAAQIGPAQR